MHDPDDPVLWHEKQPALWEGRYEKKPVLSATDDTPSAGLLESAAAL